MGASNAGGVGKNRDCQPVSGSVACCERFDCRVQITQLRSNRGKLSTVVADKRRRLLFLTGDDDEVFMTRSQSTLRRRQQSSI